MIYENNFVWFDTPKDVDKDVAHKKTLDKCKNLFDTLEDFRAEAYRYFLMLDYKSYTTSEEGIQKDDKFTEENLLENPYLTLNVTASCVETVASKVTKAKPRITFLTKNADREKREVARKLDNWILKIFKKTKVWKEGSEAFKSGCVAGLGILKVYVMNDKVKIKKIPLFDFFCDNAHKGKTKPDTAGEKKSLFLYDLIKMYPDKEKELKEAHGEDLEKSIMVYEIYRAYKRHQILTDKLMLTDEKWEKPLPYCLLGFEKSDQGVVSVGISKKLYAIQSAISYILGKTFTSIRNFAVPRVFLPKGSHPTEGDIANVVGEIIEINTQDGRVPQFSTPPAMNPQVVDILNLLWARAFEIIGVSQMSAGGTLPRGLEKASGTALRNYQQVESERFQLIRSSYEDCFIDLAKLVIKIVPDKLMPKGLTKKEVMDAKDNISIWVSSLLPDTPAGKLAMVGDLLNTGMLQPQQALSLFQSPDTDKFINSQIARRKAIELMFDRAIDKGEKPEYHSALGLEDTLDVARKMFAQIIIEMPDDTEKLNLLSACIEELEGKVSKQTGIADSINQTTGQEAPAPQPFQGAGLAV